MYSISLHGEGFRYWLCRFPNEFFEAFGQLKEIYVCTWEGIFFDLHLLHSLGFQSLDELYVIDKGGGWILNDRTSVLEVRKDGRRKLKLQAQELYSKGLLFPTYELVYDTSQLPREEGYTHVFLCQLETGGVAKYYIDDPDFHLEGLQLHLNFAPLRPFVGFDWLEGLYYEGERLLSVWEDTVVLRNKCFVASYE